MTALPTASIYQTTYQRASCDIGIVHLGFGAFHRAHQAVYIDDYMNASGDLRWAIAAVNLRESESEAFIRSQTPDGYLLKTTAPNGDTQYRLVRPHTQFADWSKDSTRAESLVSLPSVHAITVTVTESGYYLAEDGSLNAHDPVIAAEIAGERPRSIYGYLAGALERRMSVLNAPITILCCDNIRSNGKMLARNFKAYLELTGHSELAEWVSQYASFPCSMVDRITPRTTDTVRKEIDGLFPGRDLDPIHGEAFIQWVIEENFAGPMPNLTQAGVEVVPDVDPYEEAKIRILNGGHTSLAYLGVLHGHKTFDMAMHDPQLRTHFDGWEDQEVLPGITIDLPFNKNEYRQQVASRFENAAIADTLDRICMDGFAKFVLFMMPTLQSCLENGITPKFGYASIASWYVFAREFAAGRLSIDYTEPAWDVLKPMLAADKVETFASAPELWAALPQQHPSFVPDLVQAIRQLESRWPA